MTASQPLQNIRLRVMLCDHAIMCALCILPFICLTELYPKWSMGDQTRAFGLLLAVYLNKDFFNGRSPAKRLFHLQLADASGHPANELRCFVRNVTCVIWPMEVLVLLMGRRNRLGDILAGTHVIPMSEEAASLWQDVRTYRVTRYSLYTVLATVAYLLFLQAISTHFLSL